MVQGCAKINSKNSEMALETNLSDGCEATLLTMNQVLII